MPAVSVQAAGHSQNANGDVVEKRIRHFKENGVLIQAIFKKHLPADDYAAIEDAAMAIASWADVMPAHFPSGSTSEGARPAIWENFQDFENKAAENTHAARKLIIAARGGDKQAVLMAARAMGGTCKSCHDAYRNKK